MVKETFCVWLKQVLITMGASRLIVPEGLERGWWYYPVCPLLCILGSQRWHWAGWTRADLWTRLKLLGTVAFPVTSRTAAVAVQPEEMNANIIYEYHHCNNGRTSITENPQRAFIFILHNDLKGKKFWVIFAKCGFTGTWLQFFWTKCVKLAARCKIRIYLRM